MNIESGDDAEGEVDSSDKLAPLNLMSVENCLCEGNKYFRVRYQDGDLFDL